MSKGVGWVWHLTEFISLQSRWICDALRSFHDVYWYFWNCRSGPVNMYKYIGKSEVFGCTFEKKVQCFFEVVNSSTSYIIANAPSEKVSIHHRPSYLINVYYLHCAHGALGAALKILQCLRKLIFWILFDGFRWNSWKFALLSES